MMIKNLQLTVFFIFAVFAANAKYFKETIVFNSNTEGYQTYRIPAIIKAGNGDLLAFCEGRSSKSDFGEIDIVMKRSKDNGVSWGSLQVVAENGSVQAGNPGPVLDTSDPVHPNRIWIAYNIASFDEGTIRSGTGVREVMVKYSDDHGVTWSLPGNITLSVSKPNEPNINQLYNFKEDWRWYAVTPGHCLQIKSGKYAGRLVFPSNHQEGSNTPSNFHSHVFYSDDHGQTWAIGENAGDGTNESTAVELMNGDLMINSRNISGTARTVGYSSDGGISWHKTHRDSVLIEPRCQGSIIRYEAKRKNVVLFTNPASATSRSNGTVRVSFNDGVSWAHSRQIHAGNFAYSDLVIQKDNAIGLLFESDDYQTIYYANFDWKWLSAWDKNTD